MPSGRPRTPDGGRLTWRHDLRVLLHRHRRRPPAIRIHEDDDYLAFLDIRPFTRGHTLVIPKRHTVDLTDTPPPDTLAGLTVLGQRIAKAARVSGLHADGNNIAINDGKAAFQSVFHIHLHVVPRRTGDKLSFAKGLVLRRDPDREESARLLRAGVGETGAHRAGLTHDASVPDRASRPARAAPARPAVPEDQRLIGHRSRACPTACCCTPWAPRPGSHASTR